MGHNRKKSPSNKEKGKGKATLKNNTEHDVVNPTGDLTHGQSSNLNGSTSMQHSKGTIKGGTFQQTNGHSNSFTVELNVNHYPPTQDSNTSQSATQPSRPPLQPSSSQNVPTGLSSSPVDARQCTSSSSDRPQQKTNYDIYREQLELQRRGIPLWIPESNGCLPMIYQRTGVTIGDVGIVTPSGAFSFVFNICLPRDHPSQPDDLPQDFKPISLRPRDIRKFIEFKSGSHLASKAIHKVSNEGGSTDLVFETDISEGAILTLPEGSVAHDLENIPQFEAYATSNVESWYRYINGTCGRQAKNGEIRLVTGCDKTTSWGMAVIDNLERPAIYHQLRFRPVGSGIPSSTSLSSPIPLHTWDYAGFVDAKVGPYPEEIALLREDDDSTAATTGRYLNQCLFIRTLNLTLRDDVFASISDELALALTEGRSSFTSTSYSSTNSSSSNINETRSGGANQAPHGTNFGTQRAFNANIGDDRVTITRSPTAEKSHPSDTLNKKMLERAPGCRVAITRDEHWCSVITEDDESMPSNIQIAERVFNLYDIVEENGVVFLEDKKQNALPTSTSSQPLSSDERQVCLSTDQQSGQPEDSARVASILPFARDTTLQSIFTRHQEFFDEVVPGHMFTSSDAQDSRSSRSPPARKSDLPPTFIPGSQIFLASTSPSEYHTMTTRHPETGPTVLCFENNQLYFDLNQEPMDIRAEDPNHDSEPSKRSSGKINEG
ncbi:hypothetical protein BDN70DRAFT_926168 [Pholiota conissans]|uniref:Uncharacterized protein n=1 Tax=Pholiota conissans TaxID=109636 RepID=A0A9P5YM73_9AGAR|nr:hypothetical protein BDN70DRAFT_926168 [Pholiota conissans]